MSDSQLRFSTYDLADPDEQALLTKYEGVLDTIAAAPDDAARLAGLEHWDTIRRDYETWSSIISLRFQQDTRDAKRKSRREFSDRLGAQVTLLDADVKRRLVEGTGATALQDRAGAQALSCWHADMEAYAPALKDDLVAEKALSTRYTALLASARIPFEGETYNLSSIIPHMKSADRATREAASLATTDWYLAQADELDTIYDELVKLRAGMAKKAGLKDFVEMGYRRMQRVDYDRADVDRFRAEVRRVVVPLAAELRAKQARTLGVDTLMYWDEGVHDPAGDPKPIGGTKELVTRARKAFTALNPEIGAFFDGMVEQELLDLDARDGKAGGGFCTYFHNLHTPFIFANCNGTEGDVRVLVHETGHAFQMWSSRNHDLVDHVFPTYEACEVHSMGLEFLAWPQMDAFFGDDAERYRRTHLSDAITFLPYGVAVDHFQHLVYERPEATPAERRAMWQEMEALYLPWRKYGGHAHYEAGGLWQRQIHIYGMPFYYIDYTLAQTCALQFWDSAFTDREGTMKRYVELCRRGGTEPFQALVQSAGITSPFEPGCLESVVTRARDYLAKD